MKSGMLDAWHTLLPCHLPRGLAMLELGYTGTGRGEEKGEEKKEQGQQQRSKQSEHATKQQSRTQREQNIT